MNQEELEVMLKDLLSYSKETEWIEFKQNNSDPKEIGEYLSALSNSAALLDQEYGYLVYGVEDGTHRVVGTKFDFNHAKVGSEELENWLATQLNPRVDFKVYQFEYIGKSIVVFQVESTINIPVKFKSVEYVRVGSYKKPLSEFPEKERKIWNRSRRYSFEDECAISGIDEDKALELLDYSAYFSLCKIPLPANKDAILTKLSEDGLITKRLSRINITNLGAILFAKDLRAFKNLERKSFRVVLYKGTNRTQTIKEQTGVRGYAVGFEGLVDYINDKLPSNEEMGKAFRKEVKMYPEIAIRELVANAIIHQDFNESGTGPMIEIFDDRIEISNPGKPLISTLRFIDHSPKSRNEKLASFMRRIYICEERGSGIDKVVFEVELYQLPAPEFIEYESSLKVVLYSYKKPNQMEKMDKVRACYQHCCLKYVSNDKMTNQSLRDRFKIAEHNASIASRIISDTIEANLIKEYDPENSSRKYRKYVPIWA